MKRSILILPVLSLLIGANCFAWNVHGNVYCDVQQNGYLDELDTPLGGVWVNTVKYPSLEFYEYRVTDGTGYYWQGLPDQNGHV